MITYAVFAALVAVSLAFGAAYGAEHAELVPIGDNLALERTVLHFEAPSENVLPWGYVEGHITNPAVGYPVIIQIYSGNSPVHFAQAQVSENGSYEYKFRVKSMNNGHTINIFEGAYSVVVSKVVQMQTGSMA